MAGIRGPIFDTKTVTYLRVPNLPIVLDQQLQHMAGYYNIQKMELLRQLVHNERYKFNFNKIKHVSFIEDILVKEIKIKNLDRFAFAAFKMFAVQQKIKFPDLFVDIAYKAACGFYKKVGDIPEEFKSFCEKTVEAQPKKESIGEKIDPKNISFMVRKVSESKMAPFEAFCKKTKTTISAYVHDIITEFSETKKVPKKYDHNKTADKCIIFLQNMPRKEWNELKREATMDLRTANDLLLDLVYEFIDKTWP